MRRAMLLAFLVSIGAWSAADALIVPGGGSSRTDCISAFDAAANVPPTKPKEVRCADGDPSCDADGVVNGRCVFPVSVCANGTFDPTHCTSPGVNQIRVDHAQDNGDPLFDPNFQALQGRIDSQISPPSSTPDDCTSPTSITVVLGGPFPGGICKPAKKKIRLVTLATPVAGKQLQDTDVLKLTCLPPTSGCDPTVLYPSGTFERIQDQVFSRSCAVSGCHDSQTQQAGLLLEGSAAYTNLADVTPSNPVAAGRGWKRVDATGASIDTSFLYHKLTGDLAKDGSLGLRMPRLRKPIDKFLIDIIRLWIEAGAPQNGWVPGTDN